MLGEFYPSAEVQLANSTVSADWAVNTWNLQRDAINQAPAHILILEPVW